MAYDAWLWAPPTQTRSTGESSPGGYTCHSRCTLAHISTSTFNPIKTSNFSACSQSLRSASTLSETTAGAASAGLNAVLILNYLANARKLKHCLMPNRREKFGYRRNGMHPQQCIFLCYSFHHLPFTLFEEYDQSTHCHSYLPREHKIRLNLRRPLVDHLFHFWQVAILNGVVLWARRRWSRLSVDL